MSVGSQESETAVKRSKEIKQLFLAASPSTNPATPNTVRAAATPSPPSISTPSEEATPYTTTTDTVIAPKKKKRPKWVEQRTRLCSPEKIGRDIFEAKCSRGCKLGCSKALEGELLLPKLVGKHRNFYADLSEKERRAWLKEKVNEAFEKKGDGKSYCFIYKLNGHRMCKMILRLIMGAPKATLDKYESEAIAYISDTPISVTYREERREEILKRKTKKSISGNVGAGNCGGKSGECVAWLWNFSNVMGDNMPMAKSTKAVTLIRLPFTKKKDVYLEYVGDMGIRGVASTGYLTAGSFYKVWRTEYGRGRLYQIAITPLFGDFGLCDTCVMYQNKILMESDPIEREKWKEKRRTHWREQGEERKAYWIRRDLGFHAARDWWGPWKEKRGSLNEGNIINY